MAEIVEMVDDAKRSLRGPHFVDPADKRNHCVSVRVNDDELAELDRRRAGFRMQRGEYLRAAAFGYLPHVIPAINQDAHDELRRIGVNLNQIAKRANALGNIDMADLVRTVEGLQLAMIATGINPVFYNEDEDE